MENTAGNPLTRFERQKLNYPLAAAVVLLGVVLLGGLIAAIGGSSAAAIGAFALAIIVYAALLVIYAAVVRRRAAVDDRRFINWDAAMPELQRQNVNIEVRELARQLSVGEDQLNDLLSAYIVAEDLALRQIQQEENLPLMRHVSVGKTAFDAILVDQDLITCIEVAFLVVPDIRQDRIESMLKKIAQAKRDLEKKKGRLRLRLMLVLVTQISAEEEEDLRAKLVTKRFTDTPVDIDIRLLDFELLQRVYLSE